MKRWLLWRQRQWVSRESSVRFLKVGQVS